MIVTSRDHNGYTAVLVDKKFVRISDLPNANYIGRGRGYSAEVKDGTVVGNFSRSNRGNEYVFVAMDGVNFDLQFSSYKAAQDWAANQ